MSVHQKPGTNYQHAVQFHWPGLCYAPRYTNNDLVDRKDLRSTIHWEPILITVTEGKAKFTFFTSQQKGTYSLLLPGKKGTYTVLVQGMNEEGNMESLGITQDFAEP